MSSDNAHLSEHDLVLAADGELPPRRRAQVHAHLETCWSCRERMASLEGTITDFVRARNQELNAQLPSPERSGAMLRAQLAEAAAVPAVASRWSFSFPLAPAGRLAAAGGAFLAVVAAILLIFQSTVNAEGPKPKGAITPGETRPINVAQVCLYPKAEIISHNIPEGMQEEVFAAYGIRAEKKNQFEVDYLITPDLGGAESVRNLWPQPYSVRWNAHVKDRLEERLHDLVCNGRLDLATAQHDIAVDWIAAYRKYVGSGGAQ